jgi:hypothetical protein
MSNSEPNATPATPDRKSLLDQIHDAMRRAEEVGQVSLAEWMRKHADEPCPAAIGQFMEIPRMEIPRSLNSTHGWIPPFEPPAVVPDAPAPEPSRTDAVREAIALVTAHTYPGHIAADHFGSHGRGLKAAGDWLRNTATRTLAAIDAPAGEEAKEPSVRPPLDYWARVLDTAVEELHLLSGDNPPRGRSVMPLTVTLTAIAMHIRNGSVMPTPLYSNAETMAKESTPEPPSTILPYGHVAMPDSSFPVSGTGGAGVQGSEAGPPPCRIRKIVMEIDENTNGVSCTFVSCCVSWAEMREAVVLMRDKLNEQIATEKRCPFYKPEVSPDPPKAHAGPVPMVLHCPNCKLQHIDVDDDTGNWATTRLHRKHLCKPSDGGCGYVWRPFDYATVGVRQVSPSALPFTAEEARERAIQNDEDADLCWHVATHPLSGDSLATDAEEHARIAESLRHYADLLDREDAQKRGRQCADCRRTDCDLPGHSPVATDEEALKQLMTDYANLSERDDALERAAERVSSAWYHERKDVIDGAHLCDAFAELRHVLGNTAGKVE